MSDPVGDPRFRIPRLVTGDLVINPIGFALGCYPTGWIRTLEQLDRLDSAVIIPGHGEPLHDKTSWRRTWRSCGT